MLLRLAVRLKGVWSESRKFFHGTKRRELKSCIKCEAAEHCSERANFFNVKDEKKSSTATNVVFKKPFNVSSFMQDVNNKSFSSQDEKAIYMHNEIMKLAK